MAEFSVVTFNELNDDVRLDPEFYRPRFLVQAAAVQRLPHMRIDDVGNVSDGNHLTIAEHFAEEGIRYLRGQDLSDFFISDTDPLYIPEENYDALARSHMIPGDVLVSIVGTIGSVGLVTNHLIKRETICSITMQQRPWTIRIVPMLFKMQST